MESSPRVRSFVNGKLLLRHKNFDVSSSESDDEQGIGLVKLKDVIESSDFEHQADESESTARAFSPKSTIDCAVQLSPHAQNIAKKTKTEKSRKDFKYKFTTIDFLVTLVSTGIFFFDFVMDIVLANEYYYHRRWIAFGFTSGFIIVPALLSNGQSLRWYLIDYEREKIKLTKYPTGRRTPLLVWILRILFTFPLMMGPAVRHIEFIYHGFKYRSAKSYSEKKRHYKLMLYEDTDAALLRMFEAFLESAPQLVLQLFIVITETPNESFHKHMIRWAAMFGSWIGLSWSLVSYHRSLRAMLHLQPDEPTESHSKPVEEMSIPAIIGYFLWRACEVGPRLVVFSLFASQFTFGILIVAGTHWIAMTCWLLCQKTRFYKEEHSHRKRDEVIFNIVLGYAMVFSFVNARDGRTRCRALVYYLIFYVENYLMLLMWVYWTPDKSEWYYFVAIAVVPAGTILHIVFQLFYYKVCHPKASDIDNCPNENYICYQSVCHDLENENEPPAFPMKERPHHDHV